MKVLLTGRPGVGKTTVLMKVLEGLRRKGLVVAGFTCPEVRVGGRREGFDIVDIESGARAPLARVISKCESIKVGKYCVMSASASKLGSEALRKALKEGDVVAIDEIGPMELAVPQLNSLIWEALHSPKTLVAVVHRRLVREVTSLVRVSDSVLHLVTEQNRTHLHVKILEELGVH